MSLLGLVLAATLQGPSSSAPPYVLPLAPDITIESLLTVGDIVPPFYRLVGAPDGLGAFDNGDGTFTLLMNHELPAGLGAIHTHGANGAFVSMWTIRKSDLRVMHGEDLIEQVALFNRATRAYDSPRQGITLQRFCSADLPLMSAFYDFVSGAGFGGRIFMNGEEAGEGRAFAHLLDGTSYELARFGHMNFENVFANPSGGAKTIVVATNDTPGGQVYVYIGTKTSSGSPVERAGLTNGALFGVKVSGSAFTLQPMGNVEDLSQAALAAAADAAGVAKWERPEDGAWDPVATRDFYFVTTASMATQSRLWRLHFDDLAHPELGGRVDMLLDGTEGQKMMDNIAITRRGEVFIQEDPSGDPRLARIWRYAIATRQLTAVAEHDPVLFAVAGEESSGIIDASSILGDGWLLFVDQTHFAIGGELVEGGQLLAMKFPAPPAKRRAK